MKHFIHYSSNHGICRTEENKIIFTASEDVEDAFFEMSITFPEWEDDCYIMMPACAYNGNRFKKSIKTYPPMYDPEEAGVNCEPLITDVPALNEDGSGKIEVTAGDMSVPCVGIYNFRKKQSFFIFTEQEVKRKNLGFTIEKGRLDVSYPACRSRVYRMCTLDGPTDDTGLSVKAGEQIVSGYKIYTFPCDGIPTFYEQFFNLRKTVLNAPRAACLYTKELWNLMERHFNEANWSGEYYAEISKIWQCGWVGGGMSTYPLMKHGNALSKERAEKTLDFLTNHQAPSGFYYGYIKHGIIMDDSFETPGMEHIHLIRKSADVLYFLFKHFQIKQPKAQWINSAKLCADAFVRLFNECGTFGQFVDIETGKMVVGCSSSAAMAPGALAKAYEYFGDKKYLETAQVSLDYYIHVFDEIGVTNGGPGEILSVPDSESGFALLESCIALYETDQNEKWLKAAERVAHYCSSWVVPYAYKFPEGCEFDRLKINTVGSVWANVQNKHSAPGICTLSGDSLYKLYKHTGKQEYLELIKDIAYFIPQCVSTEERPIRSWNTPPQILPAGYICERVNMSDWETKSCVGEVFNHSCWPETSLILSFAELMIHDEMCET